MKKLIYFLSLIPSLALAQVGVGTDQPTHDLDIDGNLRIREILTDSSAIGLVLSVNEDGIVNLIDSEKLRKPNESGENAPKPAYDQIIDPKKDYSPDLPNDERYLPTLDLWSDQELYGPEGIQRVYFLGLRQRVTLPQNITTEGDGKIRKISFVVIQNNAPEGFGDTEMSQLFDRWQITFQTKKFEMEANGGEGCFVDDATYLYKPNTASSGLFVPNPLLAYEAEGGDATRAHVKMRYQNQIRDRAIVFYDFGGKWVMSVRD
ncbi:hypothetical protein NLM59_06390 [Weeksellaceae bacterium KMM 9724]|uniref:hypothetical protein n=1 Tax=Profundicola chukchiensis TaxID=2961959 RepID=UPI00243A3617|nr:hypothetical protein [Profundicola chukchiensis]MDG4950545.1 hypothetical protein [Profundicola chukchiensis]